jgi:hypothetical protein
MPRHILKGLIQDGPSFPTKVEKLTRKLAIMINESPEDLSYTVEGLDRVEKTVRRLYRPSQRDHGDLLLTLAAYVSEVGRREVDGRWEMRLAKDGKTWEPWIIGSKGDAYEFFTLTYKEFCDIPDESASVIGALLGKIRATAFDSMVDKAADWKNGSYYECLFSNLRKKPNLEGKGKQKRRKRGYRK